MITCAICRGRTNQYHTVAGYRLCVRCHNICLDAGMAPAFVATVIQTMDAGRTNRMLPASVGVEGVPVRENPPNGFWTPGRLQVWRYLMGREGRGIC